MINCLKVPCACKGIQAERFFESAGLSAKEIEGFPEYVAVFQENIIRPYLKLKLTFGVIGYIEISCQTGGFDAEGPVGHDECAAEFAEPDPCIDRQGEILRIVIFNINICKCSSRYNKNRQQNTSTGIFHFSLSIPTLRLINLEV